MNPPLCWRVVSGVEVYILFPIRERRISLRGWQNAFAQCPYVRHHFLTPSNPGASHTQLPICSPQDFPFSNDFLFSKLLFYSYPYRICKSRLNQTCKCPLFITHLYLLKTGFIKNPGGQPGELKFGAGILAPLHSKLCLAKWHRTNLTFLGFSFPSPS